ncbi:50S ribosomal protein L25 [Candidatus Dojkabacteria bacterium]|jgi:large subunit ribosomal protein L25|uniref:Large ribosomal subunit protein bL25 n=1 Tax=Candidatus Dojkabacteria bacterium TaxID=2099670 RepID=A0A847CZK8_9BACT|nr:50S ribosomal protein L25 [Candidatus Dojkabacteria bacterium]NLD25169.1 50S ribosomal protein L25 [Candidatus Dojkabacteria bacterium]
MEKVKFLERDLNGKKNKILLKDGFVPAVVYNAKTESKNIMLDTSTAKQILKNATSTTILDTELDGKSFKVVVKEIDINPITEELRHISFFEIDESKDMVFSIPFEIIGISPAVKNNLGVLVEVMDSIEVRCKVNDLIPSIKVDISGLEHPGQSISIDELEIPKDISLINEELKNATVVTITEMQEEIVSTPTESETTTAEASTETEGSTETQAASE